MTEVLGRGYQDMHHMVLEPRNYRPHPNTWPACDHAVLDVLSKHLIGRDGEDLDIGGVQFEMFKITVTISLPEHWTAKEYTTKRARITEEIEEALLPICGPRREWHNDRLVVVDTNGKPVEAPGKVGSIQTSQSAHEFLRMAKDYVVRSGDEVTHVFNPDGDEAFRVQ